MVALVVLEAAVLALLVVLVAGLLRSHADILAALADLGVDLRRDRIPRGRDAAPSTGAPDGPAEPIVHPAPRAVGPAFDIEGHTPSGAPVVQLVVGTLHVTLLAFLSSHCLTCHTFWNAFAEPYAAATLPEGTRVVIVTPSAPRERPAELARLAPRRIPVVLSDRAWEQYRVTGSPYFVAVDGPSGSITGEGTATRWDEMLRVLARDTDDPHDADAPHHAHDPGPAPEAGR